MQTSNNSSYLKKKKACKQMDNFPAQSGTFPNIRPTFLYAQRAVVQLQALCDLQLHASKYRQDVKERKKPDICARASSIPVTRYRIVHGQREWLEQEKGMLWPICKRPKPVSKRAGWRSSIFPSNFLLTPTRTLNIDPELLTHEAALPPRCACYLIWRNSSIMELFEIRFLSIPPEKTPRRTSCRDIIHWILYLFIFYMKVT